MKIIVTFQDKGCYALWKKYYGKVCVSQKATNENKTKDCHVQQNSRRWSCACPFKTQRTIRTMAFVHTCCPKSLLQIKNITCLISCGRMTSSEMSIHYQLSTINFIFHRAFDVFVTLWNVNYWWDSWIYHYNDCNQMKILN